MCKILHFTVISSIFHFDISLPRGKMKSHFCRLMPVQRVLCQDWQLTWNIFKILIVVKALTPFHFIRPRFYHRLALFVCQSVTICFVNFKLKFAQGLSKLPNGFVKQLFVTVITFIFSSCCMYYFSPSQTKPSWSLKRVTTASGVESNRFCLLKM